MVLDLRFQKLNCGKISLTERNILNENLFTTTSLQNVSVSRFLITYFFRFQHDFLTMLIYRNLIPNKAINEMFALCSSQTGPQTLHNAKIKPKIKIPMNLLTIIVRSNEVEMAA